VVCHLLGNLCYVYRGTGQVCQDKRAAHYEILVE
jgi:hypothetical protein